MPIYEYMCASCQKVHEVMQKFSDAPLENCPDCQSPVQKLVSLSSFALKGTGWYTTDYKRAPAAKISEAKAATPDAAVSPSGNASPSSTGSSAGAPTSSSVASAASNGSSGSGETKSTPSKESTLAVKTPT